MVKVSQGQMDKNLAAASTTLQKITFLDFH